MVSRMAATFSTRSDYDVSPRRLFELLTDPEFLERKAKHFGADEAQVTRSEEADGTVVVTTVTKKPAHWGSGIDHAEMTLRMHPETLEGTWAHRQIGMEDKSKAEGTCRIEGEGDRSSYHSSGSIEIRIPVLGRMIEKRIKAGIEEGTQKEAAYIRDTLRAAA
jgi:uncharacterized protein YndB with AHSA1/START domain